MEHGAGRRSGSALHIAPERLAQALPRAARPRPGSALFAIDGPTAFPSGAMIFRADYLQLSFAAPALPRRAPVALTATADARTGRRSPTGWISASARKFHRRF